MSQDNREEQLDRFQVVETGRCTLFMIADGLINVSHARNMLTG
ncbi:hypothetical protein [Pantoea rodasii]|nr:hypothetical protein [Pantoea rodasii]